MPLSPVMVELRATISDFRAKLGEARAEVAKLETESRGHMEKFQTFGKFAALGVAAGVGAIGVESLKMAGEFQTSTSVLQTAAGETTAGLKVVRKGILDIAASTGTTWQNLTEGMYQVEKAGFRGADGLKVLKAAAQGAKEENASLEVVTNAMTSVMASYHLGTDKSVQVMNALKTAAAGSKDTMENFAASLSTVLPIASAAGIGFDQVGGAIAALTRHGTSAHEATQELANTIRNLQAPNKQASKTMDMLGVSAVDVSQHLSKRGLGGTLEYLVDTISSKLGPSGLYLQQTFKTSQMAGADLKTMMDAMSPATQKVSQAFLDGSINVADYRKATKDLPVDQLAMARQFAVLEVKSKGFSDALKSGGPQANTMSDLLKKMLGGATGLNTALMLTGENQSYLNDVTKRTADSLHHNSSEVEGWKQTQALLNTQLEMFKQSIDRAAISLGTVLLPYVLQIITWLKEHKTVVAAVAIVLGTVLVAAIGAAVVWFVAANAVLIGIAAAFGAVVAAVMYCWQHFQTFRTAVLDVFNVLKAAVKALVSVWRVEFNALVAVIKAAIAWDKLLFNAGKAIIDGLINGVKSMVGGAVGAVKDVGSSIVSGFKSMLGISSPSRVFHEHGVHIVQGLANGLHAHKKVAVDKAKQIAAEISQVMAQAHVDRETAEHFLSGAVGKVEKAVDRIRVAHEKAADAARKAHEKALDAIAKKHEHAAVVIIEAALKTAQGMVGAQHKAIETMSADMDQMVKDRASYADTLAKGIVGSFGDVVKIFKDVTAAGADATQGVTDLQTTLQDQLNKTSAFGDKLKTLTGEGASKELIAQLAQAGVESGGALADALLAQGPAAVANINTLMQGISDAGKTAADAIAGMYYDKGIAQMDALITGMKAREDQLQAEVDRIQSILAQISNLSGDVRAQASAAELGAASLGAPHFALGTNYAPGGVALVGENGPELVSLPVGARVTAAPQTAQMSGSDMSETNDLLGQVLDALKSMPREQQRLMRTA